MYKRQTVNHVVQHLAGADPRIVERLGLDCGRGKRGIRMAKIGFIGMGNMGFAILKGLLKIYEPCLLYTSRCV